MNVFHVYTKSGNRLIIVAVDEPEAIEVAFLNGRVRKRENVKKVIDITKDYSKWHKSFDISTLSSGELSVAIDGNKSTYRTYRKDIK